MKRKLTKKQTAVAIAKDVIAQINAKKFIATHGTYLSGARLKDGMSKNPKFLNNPGRELQEVLLQENPKCKVCALGSAFLSCVRLDDDFELKYFHADGIQSSEMREKLGKFFTYTELYALESVFEQGIDYYSYPESYQLSYNLKPSEALIFIMKQIIAQKGRFDINKAEKAAKNEQKPKSK